MPMYIVVSHSSFLSSQIWPAVLFLSIRPPSSSVPTKIRPCTASRMCQRFVIPAKFSPLVFSSYTHYTTTLTGFYLQESDREIAVLGCVTELSSLGQRFYSDEHVISGKMAWTFLEGTYGEIKDVGSNFRLAYYPDRWMML